MNELTLITPPPGIFSRRLFHDRAGGHEDRCAAAGSCWNTRAASAAEAQRLADAVDRLGAMLAAAPTAPAARSCSAAKRTRPRLRASQTGAPSRGTKGADALAERLRTTRLAPARDSADPARCARELEREVAGLRPKAGEADKTFGRSGKPASSARENRPRRPDDPALRETAREKTDL